MLDISADILALCYIGTSKTGLVYKCNLNFTVIKYYIALLVGNGLLSLDQERGVYHITEKGFKFLAHYKELSALISN